MTSRDCLRGGGYDPSGIQNSYQGVFEMIDQLFCATSKLLSVERGYFSCSATFLMPACEQASSRVPPEILPPGTDIEPETPTAADHQHPAQNTELFFS